MFRDNLAMAPKAPFSNGDKLRALFAYAILGIINTLLPNIVFSASYLIIPYPLPLVLLINALPAIAAKLFLPLLLRRIPYAPRVPILCAIWALAAFVSSVTPPNVDPPARIAMSALASVCAAAGEVHFLGLLRQYGKVGLVGWGVGTGVGGVLVAVWPVIMMGKGLMLRDGIGQVYFLALGLGLAYFVILPGRLSTPASGKEVDDIDLDESAMSLLRQPSFHTRRQRLMASLRQYLATIPSLGRPYIGPLVAAFAAQAIIYPGMPRATATLDNFGSFASYAATYGCVLQLGSTLGRMSIVYTRYDTTYSLIRWQSLLTIAIVILTGFMFLSSPLVVFPLVFIAGALCGAVYVNILARSLSHGDTSDSRAKEERMGIVSVGETTGVLLGGLVGFLFEMQLCELEGERWCHQVR